MRRTAAAALAALAVLVAAVAGTTISASAQDEPAGQPQLLEVHRVDASGSEVEIAALSSNYGVDSSDISLLAEGQATEFRTALASAGDRPMEIVFVADTNSSLAQGNVLKLVGEEIATAISAQPEANKIAILSAGGTAKIESGFGSPRAEAVAAARNLDPSSQTSLYNAMSRAGAMFSTDESTFKTVVVFSGGIDDGSEVTAADVSGEFVRKGVQVLVVRYRGGEPGISALAVASGGGVFDAVKAADVPNALSFAASVASDRLLISYDGPTTEGSIGSAVVTVGAAQEAISYSGGIITNRKVALTPVAESALDSGALGFLKTGTGFALTLGLTVIGVALAVWAAGNLFAGGETSLEGMLRKYSGDDFEELSDEDTVTVQTALVKRAVELSESFAEDRGFLVRVEELLERASLPLRAGEAMGMFLGVVMAGFILGFIFTSSVVSGLVVAGLAGMFAIVGVQFKASRRIKKFEAQLPDTLQLLAGTLRAGYSLPQGLEAVSHEISEPMGYELRRAMAEARLGREIEEALEGIASRLNSPDFAWAVMAIGIQREVGGNLNELLMTVSDTMIARERLKGEVAALTAEGKLSAIVLGGLPPGLGLVMWVMNPAYINQLFVTTIGKALLGGGIVMAAIGLAWMKKVITINV